MYAVDEKKNIRFEYDGETWEGSLQYEHEHNRSPVRLSKKRVEYVRMMVFDPEVKERVPRSFHVRKMTNVVEV